MVRRGTKDWDGVGLGESQDFTKGHDFLLATIAKNHYFENMKKITILLCLLSFNASMLYSVTKEEVIEYVLENEVNALNFPPELRIGPGSVPEGFGDTDYLELTKNLSLMLVGCWFPNVSLVGSAEEIGLSRDDINEFLDLRLENYLTFLPKCESVFLAEERILLISLTVWTVGDDYPVAYHLDYGSTIIPSVPGGPKINSLGVDTLGYGAADNIEYTVRNDISREAQSIGVKMLEVKRLRESVGD